MKPRNHTVIPPRGIRCPICGSTDTHVLYSRYTITGVIIRRRECRACKHRITTIELRR